MSIHHLKVSHFRNLSQVELYLGHKVNFISGENGAGKTSLLEAVSTLASGRSFRSHKFKTLITHNELSSQLFCEYRQQGFSYKLGVVRHLNGDSVFRLNNTSVNSASQLAEALPCQIINSDSFRLIEGGPLERRHFLDWLVFHVKPNFKRNWASFNHCLKQRNALLRSDRITPHELSGWDHQLVELGELITQDRQEVIAHWAKALDAVIMDLGVLLKHQFSIEFYAGWNPEFDLASVLKERFPRDHALGHTSSGPHRADIKVSVDGRAVDEVLSRGQLKTLITALYLAQIQVFRLYNSRHCLLLVDDLPAELDEVNLEVLCKGLMALESVQIFITGIDLAKVFNLWPRQNDPEPMAIKKFHVKHGQINEVTELGAHND